MKTMPQTFAWALLAGSQLLNSLVVLGQTTASGSLDLESISINTPASASISWSGNWTLTTLNSVFSDSGGVGTDFNMGTSSSSSSASVLYASAHSSAAAPAASVSGLAGHVDGNVSLPGGFDQLASVGNSGNFCSFETTFTLSGGPSTISIEAVITSILSAIADPSGTVLHSDTIFNLNVDGVPVLSFADLVSANPGQSMFSTQSPTLSGMVTLDPGDHNLFVELDTEQEAFTVPDGTSTASILCAALGMLAIIPTCRLELLRSVRAVRVGLLLA